MVYDAIRNLLLAHVGTAALVGTRVYPDAAPDGPIDGAPEDAAYVVLRQSGDSPVMSVGGATGSVRGRFMLDHWAKTRKEVRALEAQTRQALNGKIGGTYSSTVIDTILKQDAADMYYPPENASTNGWCNVTANYLILYKE